MDERHEYSLNIEAGWPPDGDFEFRDQLIATERSRIAEPMAEGMITRLCRVPGRRVAEGLWRTKDPGELRVALTSLPFVPWFQMTIHALAPRPSD